MMRDRDYEYTGLPVHLHRRFRHGFVFVNPASGIKKPADLIGKKVAGGSFIAAANAWLHGLLDEFYGLPQDQVTWIVQGEEDIPFDPAPGMTIERVSKEMDVEEMLLNGEVGALISPGFPRAFLDGDERITRIFDDYVTEERDFYTRTGIFPIMHTTMIKREIVEKHPEIAVNLVNAFERSKNLGYQRMSNPRITPLAWWAEAWEDQIKLLGRDPWEYGMTLANRHNLEIILKYIRQQGLIQRDWTLDALFEDTGAVDPGDSLSWSDTY